MLEVVTWAINLMEAIIATKKVNNFFIDNNLMLIIWLIVLIFIQLYFQFGI